MARLGKPTLQHWPAHHSSNSPRPRKKLQNTPLDVAQSMTQTEKNCEFHDLLSHMVEQRDATHEWPKLVALKTKTKTGFEDASKEDLLELLVQQQQQQTPKTITFPRRSRIPRPSTTKQPKFSYTPDSGYQSTPKRSSTDIKRELDALRKRLEDSSARLKERPKKIWARWRGISSQDS